MLPELPHWLHSAGLASDHLWIWRDCYVWIVGWVGQKFSQLFWNLSIHRWAVWGCVLSCCRTIFFSPGHLPQSPKYSFLSIWRQWAALMVSPCGKNSSNMNRSDSQKTVLMVLRGQGIVFGFFSLAVLFISQIHKDGWAVQEGRMLTTKWVKFTMWRKNEEIHTVGYEKCPWGNKRLREWNKNLANDTSDNETYLTFQNTVVSSSKNCSHFVHAVHLCFVQTSK